MSPTENPSLLMLLLAYNEGDARILLLRATNASLFVDGDEVKRRSDTRRATFVTTFMFDDLMVISCLRKMEAREVKNHLVIQNLFFFGTLRDGIT